MTPDLLATMITEVARMIRVIAEGQTPEQKKILWDRYIADTDRFRKFFKMDEANGV